MSRDMRRRAALEPLRKRSRLTSPAPGLAGAFLATGLIAGPAVAQTSGTQTSDPQTGGAAPSGDAQPQNLLGIPQVDADDRRVRAGRRLRRL